MSVFLDENLIGNRMFFGGNLLRQPVFVNLKSQNANSFRSISNMSGADKVMNDSLFLGTYPGLTNEMIEFEIDTIKSFVAHHS